MGRTQEAQDLLKQVLAANPTSVTDLQLAGELALNSDAKTALSLLRRAEGIDPSSRNELLIARAYQRLDLPADAKIYLDRAVARSPGDISVLRALGAFYREDRKYDLAIAALEKAAAGNDTQARAELAYTYQLAGRKAEAAKNYAVAADKATGDTGLQLSAAQALVNVGDLGRADVYLKRAANHDPNHYRLHSIRGQIAALKNQPEEAIKEYQAALQNLPAAVPEGPLYPVQLHLSLYELYRTSDQAAAAAGELTTAKNEIAALQAQEQSNQPEYLRLRGLVEAASDDTAAAERDFQQALKLDPKSVTIMLNYANLLLKVNRKPEAYKLYQQAIEIDPNNNAGLTALGYLARELADAKTAESYFLRVLALYPNDYVPYLALGDLYTAGRDFVKAQQMYEKAHELAPNNPLVFAGGVNAGIEGHQLPLSQQWIERAGNNPAVTGNPIFMREHERYLTLTGKYQESADLGYKVIEKLPHDPEAPVYLAYDLLFLEKYQEAFGIVQRFEPILPKDKDLRLIAGYAHAHYGQLRDAYSDFTRAIQLDPKVSTAYMNRGWVLNDLKRPELALQDFSTALQLRPKYAEAHLGLAFASLQLHRAKPALKEADAAAALAGESKATHLARAEAYRQQIKLPQAEQSYRLALTFAPDDIPTHLALADTLYRERRYDDAVMTLKAVLAKTQDPLVYAEMARAYAELHDDADARQAIASAEQKGGDDNKVLLATGDALLKLGDTQGAMERYGRALQVPGADRVETRLALARLFSQRGQREDSEQQVSLAFAEAQTGQQATGISAQNYLDAAGVLMTLNQYELAKSYFRRAQAAGAGDEAVSIGLANAYLALGQTQDAGSVLSTLASSADYNDNYDYLIARSSVYRQHQDTTQALTDLARANRLVEGNESAERAELSLAGEQGAQLTENISYRPEASFAPIFEDINIYTLDAKLRGVIPSGQLTPPRYSYESVGSTRWRLKFNGFPVITGLVEERNARGQVSIPSELLVINRNTFDTILNGGVNPVLRFGNNSISFTPGLQYTIRRDTQDPFNLNQNLFRQYLYAYSSPFFNWISFSGSLIREAGPFTDQNLHSRDAAARLDFVVGRPWGRTSLITGYFARDVLFRPLIREYFTTDTYLGVQHRFGERLTTSITGEYLRSWRVQDNYYAIAQAIRPGFNVRFQYNPRWSMEAYGIWSRGEGDHFYDNVNNAFLVSYVRPIERVLSNGVTETPVSYPLRLSFGLQQQSFYNFTGTGSTTNVLPVIRLSVF